MSAAEELEFKIKSAIKTYTAPVNAVVELSMTSSELLT